MVYFDLKNNNTLHFFKLVAMAILTHIHIFYFIKLHRKLGDSATYYTSYAGIVGLDYQGTVRPHTC